MKGRVCLREKNILVCPCVSVSLSVPENVSGAQPFVSPNVLCDFFLIFFLYFLGQSCFTATRFMLSIDRTIVQENIPSFMSSLVMMFGSYYNFNIHYPARLASTLEFLQR